MKKAGLLIAGIFITICSYSQNMFFDSYTTVPWVATLKGKNTAPGQIRLWKMNKPTDSLRTNAAYWHFKDGLLTITNYDHLLKTETQVATYKYETNTEKGTLSIAFPDTVQSYAVAINSSGQFALLIKQHTKKKRS